MPIKKGSKKQLGLVSSANVAVILTCPSARDLRPTTEVRQQLQRRLNWEKQSAERDWVVGRPFK
jgi:hypothetical protein